MGSISYVYIKPVDQSHYQTFVVEIEGQRPIAEGQRLYTRLPPADIHLFDTQSGETIHQRKLNEDAEAALSQRLQDQDASVEAD